MCEKVKIVTILTVVTIVSIFFANISQGQCKIGVRSLVLSLLDFFKKIYYIDTIMRVLINNILDGYTTLPLRL